MWPIEMARPVLAAFREVTATAPDELTTWAHLLRFPAVPDVPEPLRGGAFVTVEVTFLGGAEEAERLLAPLRSLPAVWFDTLGTVPLAELGGIAAEPVDPMPTMELSGLLRDVDAELIDRLLASASGPGSPLMVVQLRHLGGALARGTGADGPTGALTEPYQLMCLGVPVTPEVAHAIGQTFLGVRASLDGHLTGRRTFNFLSDEDDPTSAFSPAVLLRLAAIKAAVDPHGTIRSNRPVSPVVAD
jgi:hypothetical protein